ncbi:hypothetical protein [Nitratiruptor sp. SB155-2]|uniref:hypothetical protein n=1 Tax=Nitratiruptor sp. (strain SB155-2) TaxID=387092 RepID=UPI0001586DEC|nr:hypothetical protein [Nitratiruptor sp. SB155-2]BAF69751.1 conserved hypothetical protein [Nitratiruptor sp. SB155-2]
MKSFWQKSLTVFILISTSSLFAQTEKKEIQKELEKLRTMQEILKKQIKEKKLLLEKIKEEETKLQRFKKMLDNQIKTIQSQHFKKLAKDFESMDPEYAGEKLSKIKDPKIAAYILYNMKSKKAGEALNFIDPEALNKITVILTKLKNDKK